MRHSQRFIRSESGNIIIIFAFGLPVLLGAAGAMIDYGNAIRIRSAEASVADSTALLVANAETPAAAVEAFRLANAQLVDSLGDQSATGGYKITGSWIDASNYRVTVSTTMKTAFVHLLPGMAKEIQIGAVTTVNRVAPKYQTAPPTFTQLSPDAADYNRIYAYCYSSDPKRQKDSDLGRRGLTLISDNAGSIYDTSKAPTCGEGEAQSFMLRNVRNAKSSPKNWNDTGNDTYNYYTDTKIDPGTQVLTMQMKGSNMGTGATVDVVATPMLETIICNTQKECTPKSSGGTFVDHKAGTPPAVATTSCDKGKFIYYGWEDRPGGDRDYNDIRLVMNCPVKEKTEDKKLRIVE